MSEIRYSKTPEEAAQEIISNRDLQKILKNAQDLHVIHSTIRKNLGLKIGVDLHEHLIQLPGPFEQLPSISEVTQAIFQCIPALIPLTEADFEYWNKHIQPIVGMKARGEIMHEIRSRKIANDWAPGYYQVSPLIKEAESH